MHPSSSQAFAESMDPSPTPVGLLSTSNWAAYATAHPLLRDHGLVCRGAGEQSNAMTGFRGRRLESHALVFVSRGSGTFVDQDGSEHAIVAPALISVQAGRIHGYGPSAAGWTEHWLLFDGALVHALADLGILRRGGAVIAVRGMPGELAALFGELREALGSTARHARFRASAICQRLLAFAAAEAFVADDDAEPADRVVAALRERAAEDLSLAERAEDLRLTVPELRSIVRAATGRAPHDFVVTTRIERAASLLAETALSVQEISTSVGYADPAFFSRIFARKTGVPPTAFRAQHARAEELGSAGDGG
ncbi:helix-turn-helix domain-containing protein [Microbacterium sp. PMB16]|uniref:helix-turn-helix domain-containing protein n=1 Tax=Microbacterium sp. PMB16 TaxID=3120157 RepID=UPI003F4C2069